MNTFQHLGNYTQQRILKLSMCCVFFLFFGLTNSSAQQSFDNPHTSPTEILAAQFNIKNYPNGTFDQENAFLKLNEEMDKLNGEFSRGLKYKYYWLVAVDLKRNKLPLEYSLLKNLNRVGQEFQVSDNTLKKLYNKTISIL